MSKELEEGLYDGYSEENCIEMINHYKLKLNDWWIHGWEDEKVLQHEIQHWEYKLNKIKDYENN